MNDRGVTVLLGFILLMLISITFLSVVQTYYIPSILKDRELKHSDEILSSLIDLSSAATKDRPDLIELNLGVKYPKYLFLMTPSTGSGSIFTEKFNISLKYHEIYPEQRDLTVSFPTQRIFVTLNYYVNPSVTFIYENTAIFKRIGYMNLTAADQSVFQRGRITLILINSSIGSLSANYPVNLLIVPVSYGGEIVAKDIEVEFESTNPEYWKFLEKLGYTVTVEGRKVKIEAENATLSINYVYLTVGLGVSTEQAQEIYESLSSNLKPSRIVKVTYPQLEEISVSEGQSVTLGVRVLDQFNNPLRGVYVTSNKGSGYTDSEGEFYVTFTALSDEVVTFSVNGLSVTFNISVVSAGGGGGGGIFNISWCVPSPYEWNVSIEGNLKDFCVKVTYESKGVSGLTVDISTDSPSLISIPDKVVTNESGIATVSIQALNEGVANVIATAGGSSDVLELHITGIGFCPIGWKYWREITIISDKEVRDYPVKIELNSDNFDFDHATGDDIRFYDGSKELSYWIEKWDSDNAIIWVKVPLIKGTKKIYMFYGNPSAESKSNGEATFDFFDDFETFDTSKWKAYSINYHVSNGILTIKNGGIERTKPFSFKFQDGYIVETRVKFLNTGWWLSYSGVIPEIASSPYTASGNRNKDATILYMREYHQRGVYYWIGDGRGRGYDYYGYLWYSKNKKWYVTGISVLNDEVKFWRDYQMVKKITGIKWKKDLKYIKLGSFQRDSYYDIQDTSYDWVRVRKFVDPEPEVIIGKENSC